MTMPGVLECADTSRILMTDYEHNRPVRVHFSPWDGDPPFPVHEIHIPSAVCDIVVVGDAQSGKTSVDKALVGQFNELVCDKNFSGMYENSWLFRGATAYLVADCGLAAGFPESDIPLFAQDHLLGPAESPGFMDKLAGSLRKSVAAGDKVLRSPTVNAYVADLASIPEVRELLEGQLGVAYISRMYQEGNRLVAANCRIQEEVWSMSDTAHQNALAATANTVGLPFVPPDSYHLGTLILECDEYVAAGRRLPNGTPAELNKLAQELIKRNQTDRDRPLAPATTRHTKGLDIVDAIEHLSYPPQQIAHLGWNCGLELSQRTAALVLRTDGENVTVENEQLFALSVLCGALHAASANQQAVAS